MWFKFLVVLIALVQGCSLYGQSPVKIEIDPDEASAIDLQDIANDISVVKLENSDEAIFGDVGKLLVTSNRLYVMSGMMAPRVFAFDREGKYLFNVLATGQGPNEVDRIANIAADGDDLLVYGDLSKKVLHYSPDGAFRKVYKVDFYATNFIKTYSGWLFFLQSFSSGEHGGARLVRTDEAFKTLDYLYKPKSTALGYSVSHYQFMATENGIRFVVSQSDTIMNYAAAQVRPEYMVDFGKYAVSKSLKERDYSRDVIKRMRDSNHAYLGNMVLSVPGLTGLIYAKRNQNDDRSKRIRQLFFEPATGEIRWHYYQLSLEAYKARMPFNNFSFGGKVITVGSFLDLFEFNKRERNKKSRQGISEGYGVLSLEEAMGVMKTEDNPYLFFYSIRK